MQLNLRTRMNCSNNYNCYYLGDRLVSKVIIGFKSPKRIKAIQEKAMIKAKLPKMKAHARYFRQ